MFFAFGDPNKKAFVTKPTQICEGTTKFIIGEGSFSNRQESASDKGARHLFRLGNSNKKGTSAHNRLLKEIKSGDTVVLEFGGNNCKYDWKAIAEKPEADHAPQMSLSDFHNLYGTMIAQFRELGAKPILLSLPVLLPQRFFDHISKGLNKENILKWLGGDVNTLSNWHEQYNIELFKLGKEFDVPVIDISTILLERRSLGDCYSSDGMHPNKRGHAMIAEAVMSSGLLV